MNSTQKRNARWRLFEMFGPICRVCGQIGFMEAEDKNHPLYLTLGHIKPKARGGVNARRNLQLEHRGCNNEKGARIDWSGPLSEELLRVLRGIAS